MVHKEYILITGGSGYIGAAICMQLQRSHNDIIIIDKKNPPESIAKLVHQGKVIFFKSDFADSVLLDYVFTQYKISTVIHCAASIEVGVSIKNPAEFYTNNVSKTIVLLDTMIKHHVLTIIFSSSCAVFGIPKTEKLSEDHAKNPISPYGRTKLMIEMALQDYAYAYGLNGVILRYFNAAGAWPEFDLGENHEPETHLIPCILKAQSIQKKFSLFGTQHATFDGTCVRDYLHIQDIALAHQYAYDFLHSKSIGMHDFNIGSATGSSILEIINMVERISKIEVIINFEEARNGDPAILIANSEKIKNILGWQTQYSAIDHIIYTAYNFQKKER